MMELYRCAVRYARTLRSLARRYRGHEVVLVGLQLRFGAESILLYLGNAAGETSRGTKIRNLNGALRTACECLDCADVAFAGELIPEQDYRAICVEGYDVMSMIRGIHRRMHG